MGLLVKVIALQKLACLLTVFWVRSMTIWDPLAFGWNRSGLIGRAPPMVPHWIGRHLLGLWWHRCDVDGNWPPRESGKETKHIQRWALQLNEFFIHSRSLGLFSLIQCFSFKTICTKVLCSLLFLSNKLISCNDEWMQRKSKYPCMSRVQHIWYRNSVLFLMCCSNIPSTAGGNEHCHSSFSMSTFIQGRFLCR